MPAPIVLAIQIVVLVGMLVMLAKEHALYSRALKRN